MAGRERGVRQHPLQAPGDAALQPHPPDPLLRPRAVSAQPCIYTTVNKQYVADITSINTTQVSVTFLFIVD